MARWMGPVFLMLLVSTGGVLAATVPCQVQQAGEILTVTCEGSARTTTIRHDWPEAMEWLVGDNPHPLRWNLEATRVEWCDVPKESCLGGTWHPVPIKE